MLSMTKVVKCKATVITSFICSRKKKLQGVQVSISFGNLRKYCLYIALPLSVDVVYYLCVYCYVHALAHNHAGGRVGFIPRNVPTKSPYEGRRPRFTCALHFTT